MSIKYVDILPFITDKFDFFNLWIIYECTDKIVFVMNKNTIDKCNA